MKAKVTVENGDISSVNLTEIDETGSVKGEEYPHDAFHEAMDKLPGRFVEADSHEVEAVTGATGTSDKAMQAVKRALEKKENPDAVFNGTFFGASDSEGESRNVAWVTVEDGEITDVKLEEYKDAEEEELKDENYSHDAFHEAKDKLPSRFIEANSHEVEIVTGATVSSERWSEAVKKALEKAGIS